MHPVEREIEDLATSQRGQFTRAQARALGADDSLITRRIRAGWWRRITSRVLCLPGAPSDHLGLLWTAHLHGGPDSVIGDTTALWLHQLPTQGLPEPTVLVPSGSHRRTPVGKVRQVTDLQPHHVTRIGGLPATNIARTMVDIAGTHSVPRIGALLDEITMRRRADLAEVAAMVDELRRPGKAGPNQLVVALGKRLPAKGVEQGKLERELTKVLLEAGIGAGDPQHPHPGRPDSQELVDRCFPVAKLIVEADGRSWHGRQSAMVVDRRRDREAAVAGWMTVRVTWQELVGAPDQVAGELRTIYESRRAA